MQRSTHHSEAYNHAFRFVSIRFIFLFYNFTICEPLFLPACIHFYDLKILSALCCGHRTAVVFGLLYFTNTTEWRAYIDSERSIHKRKREKKKWEKATRNKNNFYFIFRFSSSFLLFFLFILLVFWREKK